MASTWNLLDLPSEILLHIFSYIYQPWHLQIKTRKHSTIETYFHQAQIRAAPAPPSIAPLLVNRALNELVAPILLDSFTGTVNAFEKTLLQCLPDPWYVFTPRVRRLCIPNNVTAWLDDRPFINSLPELEVVEFFEEWGVLRCRLGLHPFVGILDMGPLTSSEVVACHTCLYSPCPERLKLLLMDERFDDHWIFEARPHIPSGKNMHWMENFIARGITTIVHTVFSFRVPDHLVELPAMPGSTAYPPDDGRYWAKYWLDKDVIKDLDVAFAGCQEELTVVGKRWMHSWKAEDRILFSCDARTGAGSVRDGENAPQ